MKPSFGTTPARFLALAAALACASPAPGQETPVRPDEPLVEKVDVTLVQFDMLVTDRKGKPITDLKPEEVEVYEAGEKQKLAFVESAAAAQRTVGAAIPDAAPLYGASSAEGKPSEVQVLPPPPTRRIVFAFDIKNSKTNERRAWRDAALLWVRAAMRPADRAGVVLFRTYPDWVRPMTASKREVDELLASLALEDASPDRDRRRDMTKLVSEVEQICGDVSGKAPGQQRERSSEKQTRSGAMPTLQSEGCALRIAESYAAQWDIETTDTLNVLRALVGQLAAVPGRKMVLLFSDGFVPDSGAVSSQALLGLYGTQGIDRAEFETLLRRDQWTQFNKVFEAAKAGDVSVFTFDSRNNSGGAVADNLERGSMMSDRGLGYDPWSEMLAATRDSLGSLARESGGRAYVGKKDLEDNVFAAADSFNAIYNVGYYRRGATSTGKLRIKVLRKGVVYDVPEKAGPWDLRSSTVDLDLSVGLPRQTGGGRQSLPLQLQVEMKALPFRPGGGGYGCELGIFVQAIRPDGSIAAEALESTTAAITKDERKALEGKTFKHRLSLDVPLGAYRVIARLSDDRQAILGERAVDLTVGDGTVTPGLHP